MSHLENYSRKCFRNPCSGPWPTAFLKRPPLLEVCFLASFCLHEHLWQTRVEYVSEHSPNVRQLGKSSNPHRVAWRSRKKAESSTTEDGRGTIRERWGGWVRSRTVKFGISLKDQYSKFKGSVYWPSAAPETESIRFQFSGRIVLECLFDRR